MRILHATDTYGPTVGGIEVLVQMLAQGQAADGHDVTVLTRTPGPSVRDGAVEVCRDPRAMRDLVAAADIVHGHVSAYSPVALRTVEAGAVAGLPTVATVHSVWGAAWPLFRGAAAARGWTHLPIQWAAVSDVAATPVRRALGGREVLVVPNAIDTAYWTPRTSRHAPRDGNRVTIVSVMRMSHRKRPLQLVSALREMRSALPDHVGVEVVLVGDGPLLPRVRRRVDRLGMGGWVRTPGDVAHPQLRELYRHADVYVAPATLESFGLAALEARAAGLAVVSRDGTGVTEFVTHGVDGLLCGSDRELATALAHLCRDEVTRHRLVAHNHAVPPQFDWTHVLERNTAAYVAAGADVAARPAHLALPHTATAPAAG